MRLITKTTLYYVLISVVVFTIGGWVTYDLISNEIAKETDYYMARSLEIIEYRLERAVNRGYSLEHRFNTSQLSVKEVDFAPPSDKIVFSDTLAMHPHLNQMEKMRKLHVFREIAGKTFEIIMIDVIIEDSDIYDSVVQIIIRLFALLVLALIIGSVFVSRGLLRPFHATLSQIRNFNVQDTQRLNLPDTKTREFTQLNQFINEMTGRAQDEYHLLKKFSEDASHEMQTPLAIARGKLELMADDETLSEKQFALMASAQKALGKLSQLHRSLSLLTKIENKEFDVKGETNVTNLVRETVDNFQELFDIKDLKVTTDIQPDVIVNMDKHLGGILLNNLIHNTIRHNVEGGFVDIKLTSGALVIRNSGNPPPSDPQKLFNRFEKSGENRDSSGLGLAIVKEICDFHSMKIQYTYVSDHQIIIQF